MSCGGGIYFNSCMFQHNTCQFHTSCILSLGTLAETILQYSRPNEFMMLQRFACHFRVYINNCINKSYFSFTNPLCRFWYLGSEEVSVTHSADAVMFHCVSCADTQRMLCTVNLQSFYAAFLHYFLVGIFVTPSFIVI